ncbi:hypothetical protein SAMN06272781_5474 [Streptomyces sp. 1222.2]|nr:hypothetical protein SAMN06272781_5474 [Streptomyces sp. 1222.2]
MKVSTRSSALELSPRARNRQHRAQKGGQDRGAIPSCASPTSRGRPSSHRTPSYPHLRGADTWASFQPNQTMELPPHARGRLGQAVAAGAAVGAIPRVRGGGRPDLCAVRFRGAGVELSPHARGRHQLRPDDGGRHGAIPVCAGADQCLMIRPSSVQELSPRTQDRLVPHSGRRLRHGAIPTCAGPTPGPRSSRTRPWSYPRVRETDCRPGDAAGAGVEPSSRSWSRQLESVQRRRRVGAIPSMRRAD